MRIGIDIRNLSLEQRNFCGAFLEYFQMKNEENILNIYSNTEFDGMKIIKSSHFNGIFGEQILFLKRLFQDKNDLVLTFNDTFPIFYHKRYIQCIVSLEKLLYPNVAGAGTFQKHSYQGILKTNLKKAEKILCFDEKMKKDINEKLNIDESKIEIITGFFYDFVKEKSENEISINVQQKYSFTGKYFIYDSEIGNNKNIKRLLESLAKTQHTLIFIGNKISSDLETREIILKLGIKNQVIFIGYLEGYELASYYTQSAGVIFPLLYTSFPFSLNNALAFNTKILSSDIDEVQDILGEKAFYFSPISSIEMIKIMNDVSLLEKIEINYDEIKTKYSCENFITQLKMICQI